MTGRGLPFARMLPILIRPGPRKRVRLRSEGEVWHAVAGTICH